MKNKFFAILALGAAISLFCFTSCEDDYDTNTQHVGYDDRDDDWGKKSVTDSVIHDDACVFYVNQK